MPTASSDRATNALCHSVLLRLTRCPGKGHCKDVRSHSKHYIEVQTHSNTSLLHGTTKPARASARRQGPARFIPPWKAFDAHMITLAQRADCKIHRSRKIPTLIDVTSMRQWVCLGASPDTMVQQFLIPWLRGACRHVYKGPWFPGQHARCTKPPLHLSPTPRPVYTEDMYEQACYWRARHSSPFARLCRLGYLPLRRTRDGERRHPPVHLQFHTRLEAFAHCLTYLAGRAMLHFFMCT